jgi:hypothetical protein
MKQSTLVSQEIRRLLMVACFGIVLPIPMLMHAAQSDGSDIATLYLALGAAWIAAEGFRTPPADSRMMRARFAALGFFLLIDALLFVGLGMAARVESTIPLWALAGLGLSAAAGLVPWFTLRTGQPYCAIILAGLAAGLIKISACVVARIVYGPNYIELGYASADWHTAKLMISLMWIGIFAASAVGIWRSFSGPVSSS